MNRISRRNASKLTKLGRFLLKHLNEETFGECLVWDNFEKKIFSMKATHQRNRNYNSDELNVFIEWDKVKKNYNPNEKDYSINSKQRLRTALKMSKFLKLLRKIRGKKFYQFTEDLSCHENDLQNLNQPQHARASPSYVQKHNIESAPWFLDKTFIEDVSYFNFASEEVISDENGSDENTNQQEEMIYENENMEINMEEAGNSSDSVILTMESTEFNHTEVTPSVFLEDLDLQMEERVDLSHLISLTLPFNDLHSSLEANNRNVVDEVRSYHEAGIFSLPLEDLDLQMEERVDLSYFISLPFEGSDLYSSLELNDRNIVDKVMNEASWN